MLQSTCENRIRAGRQEREGGERGGRQSGKSKFALTAREAELLTLTCCKKGKKRKKKERETREKGEEGVESFSHISNNHFACPSPRRRSSIREIERTNAFAKSTPFPRNRPSPPHKG